jgi:hypothetical protein
LAQVVEDLSNKHEALSENPIITIKRKKRNEKQMQNAYHIHVSADQIERSGQIVITKKVTSCTQH